MRWDGRQLYIIYMGEWILYSLLAGQGDAS